LMAMAVERGCGDLDPEPAAFLLQDADWDVDAALARLSPVGDGALLLVPDAVHDAAERRQRRERTRTSSSRETPSDSAGSEEESSTAQQLQRFVLPAHILRRDREPEFPAEPEFAQLNRLQRIVFSGIPEFAHVSPWILGLGPEGRQTLEMTAQMASSVDDLREAASSVADLREMIRVHQLMHEMAHEQDEADLQDALRRSAEEAYSGGFNVPPADEAMVATTTDTCIVRAGCEEGRCAVCLCTYEDGDTMRVLRCKHRFHLGCVDQWLARSGQCPVCKAPTG